MVLRALEHLEFYDLETAVDIWTNVTADVVKVRTHYVITVTACSLLILPYRVDRQIYRKVGAEGGVS